MKKGSNSGYGFSLSKVSSVKYGNVIPKQPRISWTLLRIRKRSNRSEIQAWAIDRNLADIQTIFHIEIVPEMEHFLQEYSDVVPTPHPLVTSCGP
jgi:hypothetical protein